MGIVNQLLNDVFLFLKALGIFKCILLSVIVLLGVIIIKFLTQKRGKNPFSKECLRPRAPFVYETKKRDAVLKQGFTSKKVPSDLDAIVIGSGIGGLSTAALLAKAGQKVLVLEQHDQAGGCCHTFIEKGYEFDVGIHYVGEVAGNTLTHTYVDQITDGQLGWAPVDAVIDLVELDDGETHSSHKIVKGRENWEAELKNTFPNEHKAIEKFFGDMKKARKVYPHTFILKLLPLCLVNFVIKTGLLDFFTDLQKLCKQSLADYLAELTDDKRLRAVLSYSFGDYGTQPRETPALMQMMLMCHFTSGGYYPIGGASEIAFHIIPVIEKQGGKVLVRANVTQILIDNNGKANGVRVTKGGEDFDTYAPTIVSAAGLINTYQNLVPDDIACKPDLRKLLNKVHSGHGAISIFIGLEGTAEELSLKPTNTWAFTDIDLDRGLDNFLGSSVEDLKNSDIPLLFISFPSSKDPEWNTRFPGKSNCTIVTLGKWDWFSSWEKERIQKRGEDYENLKTLIAEKAWEQTLRFYPQLKDKRRYMEVGTPLSNNYYIGSPKGEIYGLDHSVQRFDPAIAAQLRPVTPIPGLFMTGQDISTCGFAGALYSGLLSAGTILNRNLVTDLIACTKEIKKEVKKKVD